MKSGKGGANSNNTGNEGEDHEETGCHIPHWEEYWKNAQWYGQNRCCIMQQIGQKG